MGDVLMVMFVSVSVNKISQEYFSKQFHLWEPSLSHRDEVIRFCEKIYQW